MLLSCSIATPRDFVAVLQLARKVVEATPHRQSWIEDSWTTMKCFFALFNFFLGSSDRGDLMETLDGGIFGHERDIVNMVAIGYMKNNPFLTTTMETNACATA